MNKAIRARSCGSLNAPHSVRIGSRLRGFAQSILPRETPPAVGGEPASWTLGSFRGDGAQKMGDLRKKSVSLKQEERSPDPTSPTPPHLISKIKSLVMFLTPRHGTRTQRSHCRCSVVHIVCVCVCVLPKASPGSVDSRAVCALGACSWARPNWLTAPLAGSERCPGLFR